MSAKGFSKIAGIVLVLIIIVIGVGDYWFFVRKPASKSVVEDGQLINQGGEDVKEEQMILELEKLNSPGRIVQISLPLIKDNLIEFGILPNQKLALGNKNELLVFDSSTKDYQKTNISNVVSVTSYTDPDIIYFLRKGEGKIEFYQWMLEDHSLELLGDYSDNFITQYKLYAPDSNTLIFTEEFKEQFCQSWKLSSFNVLSRSFSLAVLSGRLCERSEIEAQWPVGHIIDDPLFGITPDGQIAVVIKEVQGESRHHFVYSFYETWSGFFLGGLEPAVDYVSEPLGFASNDLFVGKVSSDFQEDFWSHNMKERALVSYNAPTRLPKWLLNYLPDIHKINALSNNGIVYVDKSDNYNYVSRSGTSRRLDGRGYLTDNYYIRIIY